MVNPELPDYVVTTILESYWVSAIKSCAYGYVVVVVPDGWLCDGGANT